MPSCPIHLGIDLGGTKIHALAVDDQGMVHGKSRRETKGGAGYQGALERIAETAIEAAAAAGCTIGEVVGIGLGAPGPIDEGSGDILLAPNLGWGRQALGADLSRRLGRPSDRPVMVGNDVNLGALGEVRAGSARGARSVCAAFIGTGLGGALVIDGCVVNGAHGFGGEIGHVRAPFGDALCGCGQRGCLETVASKTGIARAISEAIASGEPSLISPAAKDGRLRSSEIHRAWSAGCPATVRAMTQAARALAWGLATVGHIVDPEVFVLGGGLIERFGEDLAALVRGFMPEYGVLYQRHAPDVRIAALEDDAVAIGAAFLAARPRAAAARSAASARLGAGG